MRPMPVHGPEQRLVFGDVFLEGEAVVLVRLLESRLSPRPRHARHLQSKRRDLVGVLRATTLRSERSNASRTTPLTLELATILMTPPSWSGGGSLSNPSGGGGALGCEKKEAVVRGRCETRGRKDAHRS